MVSKYDPSRDTVGKIYRDLQLTNKHDDVIEVGDMSRELMKDLVTDINEAFIQFDKKSLNEKNGAPYWLMIHEKKDLQMKKALLRRMLYFGYRPYPEDDTTVFYRNPKKNMTRFCWSLPHWSEMDNMLQNPDQFCNDLLDDIRAWKGLELTRFGFYNHPKLKWIPNPNHRDKAIESTPNCASNILVSV